MGLNNQSIQCIRAKHGKIKTCLHDVEDIAIMFPSLVADRCISHYHTIISH